MRSSVVKQADPKDVDLSAWIKPISTDEKQIAAEMKRLTNPYVKWESGETAGEGDIAIVRLESSVPRFNKPKVKFIIGSGMFDLNVEQTTTGMKKGEQKKAVLAEGEVTITLLEVTNRIDPEPTDEMAKALGIDGVGTVSEYRMHLIRILKKQAIAEQMYDPLNALIDEVIDRSVFILNRKDWEIFVEDDVSRARTLFELEGIRLEEAKPEQFEGRMPFHSYYEFLAEMQHSAWHDLCLYLLGIEYAKASGFSVTKADYDAFIKEYAKQWRETEDNARLINPYDAFVRGEYILHASSIMKSIIEQKWMEV